MATRADFTPEEWRTLKIGLVGAGMSVSISDGGLISAFKEAAAVSRTLQSEAAQGGLVGELADMRTDRPSKDDLGGRNLSIAALAALQSAREILAAKAPDQLATYQMAVVEVAQAVAEASKGVRPGEAATIEAIKGALGIADAAPPSAPAGQVDQQPAPAPPQSGATE